MPADTKDAVLAPCPFCGRPVHLAETDDGTAGQIVCDAPSQCLGSGLFFAYKTEGRAAAIAAWNRRATDMAAADDVRARPDATWLIEQRNAAIVRARIAQAEQAATERAVDLIREQADEFRKIANPSAFTMGNVIDALADAVAAKVRARNTEEARSDG